MSQDRNSVCKGLCLKCYHQNFKDKGEIFWCEEFSFIPPGKVEDCPGFKPISEGLTELIEIMKRAGDLK